MFKSFRSSLFSLLILSIFSSQLLSCGYVIHSERHGQKSGQVDLSIAGLDAIGILFFVIPGNIAFAVDATKGVIYLPESNDKLSTLHLHDSKKIKVEGALNEEMLVAIVKENTGVSVDMHDPRLKAFRNGKI